MNHSSSELETGMLIEVGEAADLSPHQMALVEAGKELISESLTVGREYCKSMIGICTGAIPLYLAILAFILPEDYGLGISRGFLVIIPVVLYLAASMIFTHGYFPVADSFSLDVLEEIEAVRNRAIGRRSRAARGGFAIYLLATLVAALVIVFSIGAR